VLRIGITLMRHRIPIVTLMRIRILLVSLMRIRILPHFDAVLDPDPSFQTKAQNLEKGLK
jgi:hypothetical protein